MTISLSHFDIFFFLTCFVFGVQGSRFQGLVFMSHFVIIIIIIFLTGVLSRLWRIVLGIWVCVYLVLIMNNFGRCVMHERNPHNLFF